MEIVKPIEIPSPWLFRKDAGELVKLKNPSTMLKRFREFSDKNPSYFKGFKPYLKFDGSDIQYNLYCLVHYYENRYFLDRGVRSIKFDRSEAKRIRETYFP